MRIDSSGNIIVPDDATFGLGSSKGHIEFDDTGTDEINFINCRVGIGTQTPAANLQIVANDNSVDLLSLRANDEGNRANIGGDNSTGAQLHLFDASDVLKIRISAHGTNPTYFNSGGNVGIGTTSPSQMLHLKSGDSTDPRIVLENTNADASGPYLQLKKLSASPADADYAGTLSFSGYNDAAQEWNVAQISGVMSDVTDGTEDSYLEFYTMNAGTFGEAMRITSDGIVLATAGQGIDFSATSDGAGSTTSELLDDYEEGTFNSSVAPNGSGTITMNTSFDAGYYTKVGNVVNCWFHIRTTGVSSPVGAAVIAGMPFASYNQNQMRTAGSVINVSGLQVVQTAGGSDDTVLAMQMGENTSTAYINGDQNAAQAAGFSGDEELYCHISYMAA
jgi:hypothetical protein